MQRRGLAFRVRHIGVRILSRGLIGFKPQQDSEFFDIGQHHRRRVSYDQGVIERRKNEQEYCSLSARHCLQTERQWWPMEGRYLSAPSSSPPPAPFGLRGVAVVQRDGALRPREELI